MFHGVEQASPSRVRCLSQQPALCWGLRPVPKTQALRAACGGFEQVRLWTAAGRTRGLVHGAVVMPLGSHGPGMGGSMATQPAE